MIIQKLKKICLTYYLALSTGVNFSNRCSGDYWVRDQVMQVKFDPFHTSLTYDVGQKSLEEWFGP